MESIGNFYDTNTENSRIVLTTTVSNNHKGVELIDELPSGDSGEPAIRVYRMPNGDKVVNVLSDEPFSFNASVTEWLKECLNG